jgi:hypothetical protein
MIDDLPSARLEKALLWTSMVKLERAKAVAATGRRFGAAQDARESSKGGKGPPFLE